MVQDKTEMKGRSEMIRYDDIRKDLPNEKLFALFLSVGWASEDGAAAHLHHFHAPFCGSSYVSSAWDGETLVGCARVLSDGAVRSVLYDLAVLPEYQGQGIGSSVKMGRGGDPDHAGVYGHPGHFQRFFHAGRAVVDLWQNVAMYVDHRFLLCAGW